MDFKQTGLEVINYYIETRGIDFIVNEVIDLIDDLNSIDYGRYQLKDIDQQWDNFCTGYKINKGKRFKAYIEENIITNVSITKDKANQPIEYIVH